VFGLSKVPGYSIGSSVSQLPASEKWLYFNPEYPKAFPFDLEVHDRPA
jgi:hypothetical protein